MPETETTRRSSPSHSYDYQRAYRIRTGQQAGVDVPVDLLRELIAGSAHARDALTTALGEQTVEALSSVPAQRAG